MVAWYDGQKKYWSIRKRKEEKERKERQKRKERKERKEITEKMFNCVLLLFPSISF